MSNLQELIADLQKLMETHGGEIPIYSPDQTTAVFGAVKPGVCIRHQELKVKSKREQYEKTCYTSETPDQRSGKFILVIS